MTDDIPKLDFKKNKALLIGGGLAGVIVIYEYRKSKSTAAAATAATTATDTSTTDPNAYLDPNASGYSAIPTATGYIDPSSGATINSGLYGTTTVVGPSTNSAWAQQVIAYLSQEGYDPSAVTSALGAYLAGSSLDSTQLGIVQAAIGVEGSPPNGAPAPHVTAPTGTTSGTTSSGNGVTGKTTSAGTKAAELAHLHAEYNNVQSHLRSAEAAYNASPSASKLATVKSYEAQLGTLGSQIQNFH